MNKILSLLFALLGLIFLIEPVYKGIKILLLQINHSGEEKTLTNLLTEYFGESQQLILFSILGVGLMIIGLLADMSSTKQKRR